MANKISILGGGSWGSTIAAHLAKKGESVSLWEYVESVILLAVFLYKRPIINHHIPYKFKGIPHVSFGH